MYKRRNLTDVERRTRLRDEEHIKRPENAFILFRRKCCEDRQLEEGAFDSSVKRQRQADLSKTISQRWKNLPPEERQYWEQLAKEKKKEHEQMYPNYVYRPQRSKDKKRPVKSRCLENERETGSESLSFILPMVPPRHHGRSPSTPTLPPYQTIQIPKTMWKSQSPEERQYLETLAKEKKEQEQMYPQTALEILNINSILHRSKDKATEYVYSPAPC